MRFDRNLPPLLLIFNIFEHTFITTLSDDYNQLLNSLQLMVSKVLMFHGNKELFPSGDSFYIYPGNSDPTKCIIVVLVWVPIRNQLVLT